MPILDGNEKWSMHRNRMCGHLATGDGSISTAFALPFDSSPYKCAPAWCVFTFPSAFQFPFEITDSKTTLNDKQQTTVITKSIRIVRSHFHHSRVN